MKIISYKKIALIPLFSIAFVKAGNCLGRNIGTGALEVVEARAPRIIKNATNDVADVVEERAPAIARETATAAASAAINIVQNNIPTLIESGADLLQANVGRVVTSAMEAALVAIQAQAPGIAQNVAHTAAEAAADVVVDKAKKMVQQRIPFNALILGISGEGGIRGRRRKIQTIGDRLMIRLAATTADVALNQLSPDNRNYVYEFDNGPLQAGDTLLLAAARSGATNIVHGLISHGADINCRNVNTGDTPLICATREGFFDIFALLIRAGARVEDANYEGMTALLEAIKNNHRQLEGKLQKRSLMQKFLHLGRRPDRSNIRPSLMQCAEKGWIEAAEVVITLGEDVDAIGQDGATALAKAAEGNQVGMVRFLVEHRAQDFNNAFVAAAHAGHVDVITTLLEMTPDLAKTRVINTPNAHNGLTPLMTSAQAGYVATLVALLEAGADFRVITSQGENVFTLAAANNRLGVIQALLQHSAIQDWLKENNHIRLQAALIAQNNRNTAMANLVLQSDTILPAGHALMVIPVLEKVLK